MSSSERIRLREVSVLLLLLSGRLLAGPVEDPASNPFGDLHAAAVGDARPAEPVRPPLVGSDLDLEFTQLGEDLEPRATADWQQRLQAGEGRASLIPMTPLDPTKELFFVFPGNGMNFQDLHGVAQLRDEYQIVVGISNHTRPLIENAEQLADAMQQFMEYWNALGEARGTTASRRVRVMGHSFGSATSQLMLVEMVERGALRAGDDSLFEDTLYIGNDGPWRGADLPWIFTVPVLKTVAGGIVSIVGKLLRFRKLNRGNGSVANRSHSRNTMMEVDFGELVTTHFVTVLGENDASERWRHLAPISNWYTQELGRGELERLWKFYREGAEDLGKLESWSTWPFTRKKGLRALVVTLRQDADYGGRRDALIAAAVEAEDHLAFGEAWDRILPEIVDTFEGQHTRYMWEDPRFLPWLRGILVRP